MVKPVAPLALVLSLQHRAAAMRGAEVNGAPPEGNPKCEDNVRFARPLRMAMSNWNPRSSEELICTCDKDEGGYICGGDAKLGDGGSWKVSAGLLKDNYCACGYELTETWYMESGRRADDRDCIDAVYVDLLERDFGEETVALVEYPLHFTEQANIECLLDAAPEKLGDYSTGSSSERTVWSVPEKHPPPRHNSLPPVESPVLKEVVLFEETPILAVGALNGRLGSLWEIHRIWTKDLQMQPYVVFLGDAVDEANRQLEVAAALLAWRAKFPEKVIILRGTHELIEVNWNFRCVGGGHSIGYEQPYPIAQFYQRFNDMFMHLPRAVRIVQPESSRSLNAVFAHGGFGVYAKEELRRGLDQRSLDARSNVPGDISWAEPSVFCRAGEPQKQRCNFNNGFEDNLRLLKLGKVGEGHFYYSNEITKGVLRQMDACILVTGHTTETLEIMKEAGEGGNCEFGLQHHVVSSKRHPNGHFIFINKESGVYRWPWAQQSSAAEGTALHEMDKELSSCKL